jgi:hypothetical protein
VLKNFTLIALMFILPGCLAADIALLAATVVPVPLGNRAEYEPMPPKVITSTDDRITVKYRSVGPDVQHDEAMQLITDHCEGSFVETNRVNMSGWLTVEADCTEDADTD